MHFFKKISRNKYINLIIVFVVILGCKENPKKNVSSKNMMFTRDSGLVSYVFKDSVVISKIVYFDSEKNSMKIYNYYENGNVRDIFSVLNGDSFLNERFTFYKSGKLKTYSYRSKNKLLFYEREFNEIGEVIEEDGEIFHYSTGISTPSKKGAIVGFEIYVCQPPKFKVEVINNKTQKPLTKIKHLSGDYYKYECFDIKTHAVCCDFTVKWYDSIFKMYHFTNDALNGKRIFKN